MAELARDQGEIRLGSRGRRDESRVAGVVTLGQRPFQLDSGGQLSEVQVAYEIVGPSDAPVIAVLGGISASRYVTASTTGPSGWWADLCGPALALDTNRYRLLSWDFLGGNGATTGPRSAPHLRQTFPDVTTFDQARVAAELLTLLGIQKLHTFVGASYGGMVALAFAAAYPTRVRHILAIVAAHRSAPLATGWRTIQRQIVQLGLTSNRGDEGLAIARALGMSTYRTPDEFTQRFGGSSRSERDDPDSFPVWSYLKSRGDDYVKHMDPYAFLALSRSIDLHEVDPSTIEVPTTLAAVRQDQLVPLSLVEELADAYKAPCELKVLDSHFGHDAFLKEADFFSQLFRCL